MTLPPKPRVAIIGAGIGGAGLAWQLGKRADVTLIEAESQPGYHTTGRSAAFYAETYGGPLVQPLTTASLPFFETPPDGFSAVPLLAPRGGLHIATAGQRAEVDALAAEFAGSGVEMTRPDAAFLERLAPQLRDEWRAGTLWEPGCRDIDVAALHQGYLAGARRSGATQMCDAEAGTISRDSDGWRIGTRAGEVRADILVNAAGAWADGIAALAGATPLGLTPLRRTMVVLDVDPAPSPDQPVVIAVDGSFYFKPDAGRLWVSPHDETPSPPCDAQPEELDVAIAIDRFVQATHYRVRRVERSWAGLRTFAPDRLPVIGFDRAVPGLFWCAGQGGFGIQTAPAASRLAAAVLLGEGHGLPGIDAAVFSPMRFG